MFHRIIASITPTLLGVKAFLRKLNNLIERYVHNTPLSQWEEALFNSADLFTKVWMGGRTLRGVVAR